MSKLLDDLIAAGAHTSVAVGVAHNITEVANTAGVLTTLDSFLLPVGIFGTNGDSVEFEYYGTFSAVSGANLLLVIGGQTCFDSGDFAPAGGGWCLAGRIIRVDATHVVAFARFTYQDFAMVAISGQTTIDPKIPNALALKGLHASADKILFEGRYLTFYQLTS